MDNGLTVNTWSVTEPLDYAYHHVFLGVVKIEIFFNSTL